MTVDSPVWGLWICVDLPLQMSFRLYVHPKALWRAKAVVHRTSPPVPQACYALHCSFLMAEDATALGHHISRHAICIPTETYVKSGGFLALAGHCHASRVGDTGDAATLPQKMSICTPDAGLLAVLDSACTAACEQGTCVTPTHIPAKCWVTSARFHDASGI